MYSISGISTTTLKNLDISDIQANSYYVQNVSLINTRVSLAKTFKANTDAVAGEDTVRLSQLNSLLEGKKNGTTGAVWSTSSTPDNQYTSVAYGNGLYVAVAASGVGNRAMWSYDCKNWNESVTPNDLAFREVVFGDGVFVAVAATGTGNRVMWSYDGKTWVAGVSAADNSWYSVTYGKKRFVAVSYDGGTNQVMYSDDKGKTWVMAGSTPIGEQWQSVTFGNDRFVAVSATGSGNRAMYSDDGETWILGGSTVNNEWTSVDYGDGLYVAVAASGVNNRIMTSTDGINWTIRTTPVDNYFVKVRYGGGIWVAIAITGVNNRVMTSTDAITWEIQYTPVDNSWYDVDYGNGMFVAVSATGTGDRVMTSGSQENSPKRQIEQNSPDFESVNFATTDPPVVTSEGTVFWNNKEYTINIVTGLGPVIQIGQEVVMLFYNDSTTETISNLKAVRPKAAAIVEGIVFPTLEYADASKWETTEGTISVTTMDIPPESLGFTTRFGRARGGDTSGFTPGEQLWLSADGTGSLINTRPVFPDYQISMGGALNSEVAPDGEIFVSITRDIYDTFNDDRDGSVRETFDFRVSSDGVNVTGTLTNVNPARNLTLIFSDGFFTLDTTTVPLTIALTPGTDPATTTNHVYIPKDTKVLTLSTTGFPATEHCKIAQLEVQSAATVQSETGAERNQNINDHIKEENDNGHLLHMAERLRRLNADHDTGTEGSLIGTPTNGYIEVTGGKVWQLHKQDFGSFSMPTRNIIIANDNTTPNRRTNNLNTITAYSNGSAWNNEWGKIIVYGIANKSGEPDFVKLNLPVNGYNSEANAIADALNYADYTIPNKYKGVGFLIAAFTVRIGGGTVTYNGGTAYQDLRGFVPNNIAGGGGGSGITTFLGLIDVLIASYSGQALKGLRINGEETGVEAYDVPKTATVAVSSSELLNLHTTAKDLLTAVTGKYIDIKDAHIVTGAGTQYAAGVILNVGTLTNSNVKPLFTIDSGEIVASKRINLKKEDHGHMDVNEKIILSTESALTLGSIGFSLVFTYIEIT
jgi:hypothetical protein